VAYFESGISKDLLDIADNRHLLDRNFFNDIWVIQHRPQPLRRRPVRKIISKPPYIPNNQPNHGPQPLP
jgi:hypothetical protein